MVIVVTVNGSNGSGKDTMCDALKSFVEYASKLKNDTFNRVKVFHISSVDRVKNLALNFLEVSNEVEGKPQIQVLDNDPKCYWHLTKVDDASRELLVDLKKAYDKYNDFTTKSIVYDVNRICMECWTEDPLSIPVILVDIRELDNIVKMEKAVTSYFLNNKAFPIVDHDIRFLRFLVRSGTKTDVANNPSDQEAAEALPKDYDITIVNDESQRNSIRRMVTLAATILTNAIDEMKQSYEDSHKGQLGYAFTWYR